MPLSSRDYFDQQLQRSRNINYVYLSEMEVFSELLGGLLTSSKNLECTSF